MTQTTESSTSSSTTRTVGDILRDGSWQRRLNFSLSGWVTLGLLVGVIALNASLQPTFFTEYSITSNFATFAPLVLVAVGQAIVVIGGGLDLSVGSNLAVSSVVSLRVMDGDDSRILLGMAAGVATGALCGLLNGVVIAVVRLQPLIATYATGSVFAGAALVVLPSPGGSVPGDMVSTYRDTVAGLPVAALIVLACMGVWLALDRTRLLRHIRAVGGNEQSAYTSLVPVVRSRAWTYTLAGAFVGAASLTILANSGSGDPFIGEAFVLDSIAAVVLGGIALSGGRGTAIGAVAGAIILTIIDNVLGPLGVPTFWRPLTSGLVIIAAFALSVLTNRRESA
ncbi:ABC transporter permease [Georgenia sp. Z1491]|uniref:ABC transporter permease n=1 Tax=Georgenia sp. Z1491 TaxID=3416707 RepID=UPI003CFADB39